MKRFKSAWIVGLVIITALLLLILYRYISYQNLPVIHMKASNITIRQDEELPALSVDVEVDKEDEMIEDENDYSVSDLVKELQEGKHYQIVHTDDLSKEGEYQLEIKLDDETQKKIDKDWKWRVRLELEDGSMTILNKYGDWEGKKFLKTDGTYASGWMDLGTSTYYFNEQNEYVTGEQKIGNTTFYFSDEGILDENKNTINPAKPMLALTFDDGPGKYTMDVLNLLEQQKARATFFVLGDNVPKFPEEIKKMSELSCEIGNHSTSHPNLKKLDKSQIQYQLQTTEDRIYQIIGKESTLVRPPYGAVNETVRSYIDKPIVLWTVDTLDWKYRDTEYIKKYIIENAKDGEILLMHDIHQTTVEAMKEVIPELVEEGYQLVTVSELKEFRDVGRAVS